MKNKTVAVSAIREGSVVDHITPGSAMKVLHLLGLVHDNKTITCGFYLPSKTMGQKDLIKIEGRELIPAEASSIAVLAPKATISIIKNYTVVKKLTVKIPHTLEGIITCPNARCITHFEDMKSFFYVLDANKYIHSKYSAQLKCKYCEKLISQDEIKEYARF